MIIHLLRLRKTEDYTFGCLFSDQKPLGLAIERAWRPGSNPRHSCIPAGDYFAESNVGHNDVGGYWIQLKDTVIGPAYVGPFAIPDYSPHGDIVCVIGTKTGSSGGPLLSIRDYGSVYTQIVNITGGRRFTFAIRWAPEQIAAKDPRKSKYEERQEAATASIEARQNRPLDEIPEAIRIIEESLDDDEETDECDYDEESDSGSF